MVFHILKSKELRIEGQDRQRVEKIGHHLLIQVNEMLIMEVEMIIFTLFINGIILRF